MKFWPRLRYAAASDAGATDNDRYSFLAKRKLDEVNFWRPSPGPYFTDRSAGTAFLFRVSGLTPWSKLKGAFLAQVEYARRSTGFPPLTATAPCR